MKTKILPIIALLCVTIGACRTNAQGTQTYNYVSQTVSNSTFSYGSQTYDLSGSTSSQNTRFLVTTTAAGAQVIGQIIVNVDGIDYTLVTQGGGTIQNLTGELNLELSNTSHTIILKLKADASSITFTTPQLIVSPTETNQLQNELASITNQLNTLSSTVSSLDSISSTELATALLPIQNRLDTIETSITGSSASSNSTEINEQFTQLAAALERANSEIGKVKDQTNPLSPTNLALSIGPSIAGILGSALISPAFDAPQPFSDEVLFIEE